MRTRWLDGLAAFTLIACALTAVSGVGSTAMAAGVSTTARAISYADALNVRQIFAFARGSDGHLWADQFNGTAWTWVDHGLPTGATSVTDQQPITYVDGTQPRRIYVFAVDNTKHLVVRYWNGSAWQWANQGGPELKRTFGSLSVITYVDDQGNRRIYCFAIRASDSHIMANYWNGSTWQWADLGVNYIKLTTQTINFEPVKTKALTFSHLGTRFIEVFCLSNDPGLNDMGITELIYTSGIPYAGISAGWFWDYPISVRSRSFAPYSYVDNDGVRHQHVFYGTYQEGQSQLWFNQEIESAPIAPFMPPIWIVNWSSVPGVDPALPINNISAITYPEFGGGQLHYAFMDVDGRLYGRPGTGVAYWNGSTVTGTSWSWELQGAPAGYEVSNPEAITYIGNDGVRRIHVFMYGQGRVNALFTKYWNGTMWAWTNLGAPP